MGKAAIVLVYVVGTVVAGAVVAAAGCCCWRRLRYPRRGCFDVVATTLADEPSAYPSIQRLMSLLLTLRGYCTPREAKERPPSRRASLSAEFIATVPCCPSVPEHLWFPSVCTLARFSVLDSRPQQRAHPNFPRAHISTRKSEARRASMRRYRSDQRDPGEDGPMSLEESQRKSRLASAAEQRPSSISGGIAVRERGRPQPNMLH